MINIFLLFLTVVPSLFANDGTIDGYKIWEDLGVVDSNNKIIALTGEEYFYLSAQLGIAFGFIFGLSIILLLVRR